MAEGTEAECRFTTTSLQVCQVFQQLNHSEFAVSMKQPNLRDRRPLFLFLDLRLRRARAFERHVFSGAFYRSIGSCVRQAVEVRLRHDTAEVVRADLPGDR